MLTFDTHCIYGVFFFSSTEHDIHNRNDITGLLIPSTVKSIFDGGSKNKVSHAKHTKPKEIVVIEPNIATFNHRVNIQHA